jgi:dihydroorotate dehydrogenase (NAD+) catalytic subunit
MAADLTVHFAGLTLRNPILSASGTFGHGLEMRCIVSPSVVGGLVSKTVTRLPRPGNPMPRIAETEAGFLNSIGLENRGIRVYLDKTLVEVSDADTLIVTNIGGHSAAEFAELAEQLDARPEVDALEVNLSCPNVDGGKLPFSTDPRVAEEVMRRVRAVTTKPLFAKLSPNVTRIEDIAVAVEAGGADAITAVNTVLGVGIDWRTRKPRLNTIVGGYSGTGIKPIALRCALACVSAVDIPVIGCGGITTAADVLEFMVAGCVAVQVGTASFAEPGRIAALVLELEALLDSAGIAAVRDLVGTLDVTPRTPLRPAGEY